MYVLVSRRSGVTVQAEMKSSKIRGTSLYYFLTEICVQSSTVAQQGLILEASNLDHRLSVGVEGSTTTLYVQVSTDDNVALAGHRLCYF